MLPAISVLGAFLKKAETPNKRHRRAMRQRHALRLAAALLLAACAAKHIKSRKSGKKKYARVNDVWAFSAQTRNWTNLIADADEPQIQAAAGLPACLANDSVQLAIALVVAFLVTGAALRARFRHDDAYDGPPGVQASPYVGVA